MFPVKITEIVEEIVSVRENNKQTDDHETRPRGRLTSTTRWDERIHKSLTSPQSPFIRRSLCVLLYWVSRGRMWTLIFSNRKHQKMEVKMNLCHVVECGLSLHNVNKW